jgi:hypothetical protein
MSSPLSDSILPAWRSVSLWVPGGGLRQASNVHAAGGCMHAMRRRETESRGGLLGVCVQCRCTCDDARIWVDDDLFGFLGG